MSDLPNHNQPPLWLNKANPNGKTKLVDPPLIGILVSQRSDGLNALKLYRPHHDLPMKMYAFTPADILWQKQRIAGVHREGASWKEATFPFPDAVYNRCYNKTDHLIRPLENVIGRRCFNVVNHFSKWAVYKALEKSCVDSHLPSTFLYDRANISELLARFNLLFIKPVYGRRGVRVHRIELKDDGDTFISLHSLAPRYLARKNENLQGKLNELLGSKQYIVQKGIRSIQVDGCYYDLRVLMQKDLHGTWAVSAVTCRVAYEDFFNTGIYKGIYDAETFLPQLLPQRKMREMLLQSLHEISVNATARLETQLGLLGELSVDFMVDEEWKPWIIELNGKPQKSIYREIIGFKHYRRVYRRPLEYAYYLSQS